MRTMKDKERLMIIIKIFLDMNGPATSNEIASYINRCPVPIQSIVTPYKIGQLLRQQKNIKIHDDRVRKYSVEI